MSEKRSKSGLLSRIAAPITKLMARQRSGLADMSVADAEREMGLAEESARAAAANPPRSLTPEDFSMAIGQILSEDDGKFGTKLQVISLVEFREAVGERWDKIAGKVMLIAEGVINMHIGPGNIYSRQGIDFFVLLFRSCGAQEGRRRALVIAQELGTRLIGDQFQSIELPLALAAELDMADALDPDGALNLAALEGAVDEMRSLIAETVADKTSRGWVPPATHRAQEPNGLRRHMLPSTPLPKEPIAPPIPKPDRASGSEQSRPAAKEPAWKLLEGRKQASATAWVEIDRRDTGPTLSPGPEPLSPETQLSLLWRPSWVAAGETIGAYKAQVQRVDAAGEPALEGARAYPRDDVLSANTLDRYAIANAVRDFRTSESNGNNSTAIIPIHWLTLSAGNRTDFLAPFADLSQASRSARVVIDLFGVPDDVTAKALAETLRAAKPLCRAVMLRGRLSTKWAQRAADCGAAAVGIDLAELAPDERTDDDDLLTALRQFHQTARKAGIGTYVWGARKRKVVAGAVQIGFGMVNGTALMKDIAKPAKLLPAPKARFAAPSS